MSTKKLYLIITDSGDGSQGIQYTFDSELVNVMDQNQEQLSDSYQSGDGLQVKTLNVPMECTYESLGIAYHLDRDDFPELFEEE